MANTSVKEIIDSFESSFVDRHVLPDSLEMVWLRKAVSRYSVELEPLTYDDETMEFDSELNGYVIDTLAEYMLEMYQERQVSLANKRISIVGKDLSVDSGNGSKVAERASLERIQGNARTMTHNQKPTAYA